MSDANFSESDLKAAMAVLHVIVTSAGRFSVEEGTVATELQQLGLPKENSEAISRAYKEARAGVVAALEAKTVRVGPRDAGLRWRVDVVVAGNETGALNAPTVSMGIAGAQFEMSAEQFAELHAELKTASVMMERS